MDKILIAIIGSSAAAAVVNGLFSFFLRNQLKETEQEKSKLKRAEQLFKHQFYAAQNFTRMRLDIENSVIDFKQPNFCEEDLYFNIKGMINKIQKNIDDYMASYLFVLDNNSENCLIKLKNSINQFNISESEYYERNYKNPNADADSAYRNNADKEVNEILDAFKNTDRAIRSFLFKQTSLSL